MRKFWLLVKILLVLVIIGSTTYWYLLNKRADNQDVLFTVNRGDSFSVVSERLKQQNLIPSVWLFEFYYRNQTKGKMLAGDYLIRAGANVKNIAEDLNPDRVGNSAGCNLTFLEGYNFFNLDKTLKVSDGCNMTKYKFSKDEFIKISQTPIAKLPTELKNFSFLKSAPANATLSGYLFPDTYNIDQRTTTMDLIANMLNNFQKKTAQLSLNNNANVKNWHQLITMASIVEKEVRSVNDMKIVAGIFWQRIRNNQGLDSCATLAFILRQDKPQYSYEDTQVNSPYNTYRYRGLPPGPISNPGLRAIEASLQPTSSPYNYFLSDPATSKTIFSRDLNEHNVNKLKYLK